MEQPVYGVHSKLQADDSFESLTGYIPECYFPWTELSHLNMVHKTGTAAAVRIPPIW